MKKEKTAFAVDRIHSCRVSHNFDSCKDTSTHVNKAYSARHASEIVSHDLDKLMRRQSDLGLIHHENARSDLGNPQDVLRFPLLGPTRQETMMFLQGKERSSR